MRSSWVHLGHFTILAVAIALVGESKPASAGEPIDAFIAATPTEIHAFSPAQAARLRELVTTVDQWFADAAQLRLNASDAERIALADRLTAAHRKLWQTKELTFDLRWQFAAARETRKPEHLVGYVATLNALVDVIARANYTLLGTLDELSYDLADDPKAFREFCNHLTQAKSQIGAMALAPLLVERRDSQGSAKLLLATEEQLALLRMISAAPAAETLDELAEFVRLKEVSPYVLVVAAETIRRVGLPQEPMPDGDRMLPQPQITAKELYAILKGIDLKQLDAKRMPLYKDLLAWLDVRQKRGIVDKDTLLLEGKAIQPGDWMLMRNPSPYNLFSDLAPGLYTHVGVVAATTPADGIRRIVVVDLPERGTKLPATPVDMFVKRTLSYAFLRHDDKAVASKMASVAAQIIGNPSQFDLNFRIDRVNQLRGQPLAGKKITTYCAGLLWLCAQETGRERAEFFPIPERGAGGKTAANLAKLGLSIGDDFVSPTGPLFSVRMAVVAERTPMYLPQREIEQAVFDHFARSMKDRELAPSLDQYQSLRLKLAEAAKANDLLSKALAKANNVSEEMDLVSAAKAAAVVETLDEIAFGASAAYGRAFDAIVVEDEDRRALSADERSAIEQARKSHAELYGRWSADRLSSRELRQTLVRHYIDQGCRQIDKRFFGK